VNLISSSVYSNIKSEIKPAESELIAQNVYKTRRSLKSFKVNLLDPIKVRTAEGVENLLLTSEPNHPIERFYGSRTSFTSLNNIPLKSAVALEFSAVAPLKGNLSKNNKFAFFPKIDLATNSEPSGKFNRETQRWPDDGKWYSGGTGGSYKVELIRRSRNSLGAPVDELLAEAQISPREEWLKYLESKDKTGLYRPRSFDKINEQVEINRGDNLVLRFTNTDIEPSKNFSSINLLINQGSRPFLSAGQEIGDPIVKVGSRESNDSKYKNLAPFGFYSYTAKSGETVNLGSNYLWSSKASLGVNGEILYPGAKNWSEKLLVVDSLNIGNLKGNLYEWRQVINATSSRESPLKTKGNIVTSIAFPVVRESGKGSLNIKLKDEAGDVLAEAAFMGGDRYNTSLRGYTKLSDGGQRTMEWPRAKFNKSVDLQPNKKYYLEMSSSDSNTSFRIEPLIDATKYGWPNSPELSDGGNNSYAEYKIKNRGDKWQQIPPSNKNLDIPYALIYKN
jgi:hypothetical protein